MNAVLFITETLFILSCIWGITYWAWKSLKNQRKTLNIADAILRRTKEIKPHVHRILLKIPTCPSYHEDISDFLTESCVEPHLDRLIKHGNHVWKMCEVIEDMDHYSSFKDPIYLVTLEYVRCCNTGANKGEDETI